MNFKNQKVGILGLGEENAVLVKFLKANGAHIIVCDRKSREELGEDYDKLTNEVKEFRLGSDYLNRLTDFDVIFRTPGLPYFHPKIQKAKKAGVEISSQTKLFFDLCPSPIIGVTGTKGKGTTTTLISKILENSKLKTQNSKQIYLGGNIGLPPMGFLDQLTQNDIVVLELSSFQLQDITQSPHIAVVLDIKVDHLDYHQNRKEYVKSKMNIVKHQNKNDFAIINADYLTSFEFGAQTPAKIFWFSRRKSVDQGCWVRGDEIVLRMNDEDLPICKTAEIILKGQHNWENICAAACASYLAGASLDSIKKVVTAFKGLEHRLEFVGVVNGISFYNDSFSTTPDTTIAAINSFTAPIILLVGGSEKNADYLELGKVIRHSSVKAIISIGLTSSRIIDAVGQNHSIEIIKDIKTMAEAVDLAFRLGHAGDVVLLTPASASFDRYKNYQERGIIFKKAVKKYEQT